MTELKHPKSALVVDDDPIIRMDACAILEDAGSEAHEAENGDAAIAFLERRDGDVGLVFTDVQMPNGSVDGFGVARHVAEHWPWVGILVASGRIKPSPDDLPDGATFVSKPFSAGVVHDRVRDLLPAERLPAPLRDGEES